MPESIWHFNYSLNVNKFKVQTVADFDSPDDVHYQ